MKRRIVASFLVLFALWPIAHFALTQSFGTDPWKLFGWAMYCVPGPMKTVRVVSIDADGKLTRLSYRGYTQEEQVLVDTFRARRSHLGALASPEALAQGMLALHPEFSGVLIAVLSLELDRETALVTDRFAQSTHWRDARHEPLELPEETLARLFGP